MLTARMFGEFTSEDIDEIVARLHGEVQQHLDGDSGDSSVADRIKAYATYVATAKLDPKMLDAMSDPRARAYFLERWKIHFGTWFGEGATPGELGARLLAEGIWLERLVEDGDPPARTRAHLLRQVSLLLDEA